jgi:hypothetical protein
MRGLLNLKAGGSAVASLSRQRLGSAVADDARIVTPIDPDSQMGNPAVRTYGIDRKLGDGRDEPGHELYIFAHYTWGGMA